MDTKRGKWGQMGLRLFGAGANDQPAQDESVETPPFGLRSQILSPSNSLLYRALVAAVAADAVVFAKVRLADFMFVSGGDDDVKHSIKMDRKFVDFLLCDPFSMQPLVVVELTKKPVPGDVAEMRDPFITKALKTAGISLLKIEAQSSYPVKSLRNALAPKIVSQRAVKRAGGDTSDADYDSVELKIDDEQQQSSAAG